jgi:hypothetical protein
MAIMSTTIASPGRMGAHNHSAWRRFVAAVLEPLDWNIEEEIVEYLQYHRHDLPPGIWIELERRRPDA